MGAFGLHHPLISQAPPKLSDGHQGLPDRLGPAVVVLFAPSEAAGKGTDRREVSPCSSLLGLPYSKIRAAGNPQPFCAGFPCSVPGKPGKPQVNLAAPPPELNLTPPKLSYGGSCKVVIKLLVGHPIGGHLVSIDRQLLDHCHL